MKKMLFGEVSYMDETIASTSTKKDKQAFCKIVDELKKSNKKNNKQKTAKPRKPKTHAT